MSTENWSQPLWEMGRLSEPSGTSTLAWTTQSTTTPPPFYKQGTRATKSVRRHPGGFSSWEGWTRTLVSPVLTFSTTKLKKKKEGGRGRQPRGGEVGRKGWKGSGSGKLVARMTQHERGWHGGSWERFERYRRSYGILDFFHILDVPETGGGGKLKRNCPLGFTIREPGISWSPLGPIPRQGDFYSGPVVKTPHTQYRVPGLDPWSGNYILHSTAKNSLVTAKTGNSQINWKKKWIQLAC